MAASVEEVSSSVVREYLSRKGLKKTIACMDEEHPRTEASINNRSRLRQILKIEGLYRKNKAQNSPLKTLLEIIVKYHIEDLKDDRIACPDSDCLYFHQTISSTAHSLAVTSTIMNDIKPNESAMPLVNYKHGKLRVRTWPTVAELSMNEMVLDDIDDDDDQQQDLHKVSIQRTVAEHSYIGCPMDQNTAMELKTVLLGSSLNCFSVEWRNQGFTFSETHDLRYGIVQKKGGPCGILASLQAFVLKKLLFENTESSNTGLQRLRPSNITRRKYLVLAAAEILWRAGEEKQATVVISSGRNHFTPTGHYKSEGLLEKITYFTVDSIKDLQLLLEQHIEQFETGVFGCILLTISAILSRSIEKVREDMDVPTTTLIGAHGYCTQELVNLLLCGRAVSNVFDNDMELDSGNGNITLLKGIKGHCDIGFLSLFEHYNICKVGAYLKTPRYPIWVVCSESHFSVLFGLQRELLTSQDKNQEFDLYYYDGLANQQEEIRLTVSFGNSAVVWKDDDTDLIAPLEHCIRTRWNDALVNWNDTEPIL
ncbi:probable ubiquitin carboxyl-terminal hydrolase MINDY-4 isoform X2 [Channa argus]|uniref:probable ubiquitin carboxyl-terminal hydrolase MINDY-4 isoform X2 n=1 Tax=Channa argus TaxID=215402 RepID=UPI003521E5ED